jgi:hypothetical protein
VKTQTLANIMNEDGLLDPKNDYVFKKLFAEAPTLLASLINAVRSDEIPVEVLEVTNPRIEPEDIKGKFIVNLRSSPPLPMIQRWFKTGQVE